MQSVYFEQGQMHIFTILITISSIQLVLKCRMKNIIPFKWRFLEIFRLIFGIFGLLLYFFVVWEKDFWISIHSVGDYIALWCALNRPYWRLASAMIHKLSPNGCAERSEWMCEPNRTKITKKNNSIRFSSIHFVMKLPVWSQLHQICEAILLRVNANICYPGMRSACYEDWMGSVKSFALPSNKFLISVPLNCKMKHKEKGN